MANIQFLVLVCFTVGLVITVRDNDHDHDSTINKWTYNPSFVRAFITPTVDDLQSNHPHCIHMHTKRSFHYGRTLKLKVNFLPYFCVK